MKKKPALTMVGCFLAGLVIAGGCAEVTQAPPAKKRPGPPPHARGHGPPPHAPAHGYHAKTEQGIEIEFNSSLGVYVVVGVAHHYYHERRYYRKSRGRWEAAAEFHGSWVVISEDKLPPGLRGKGKGKSKSKGKGNDKGKVGL